MKNLTYSFLIAVLSLNQIIAQQTLPTIKACSEFIDIRDGGNFREKVWKISPEIQPDIYHSNNLGGLVTFYTDLDSISVRIEENVEFDFIVIVNNTDSAYTRITYKEPYLMMLKKAGEYDENQNRNIPQFTYLGGDNEDLKRIRSKFKLDSIAGTGNETSRMINIMRWVHNVVRHDGTSYNPPIRNAIDLVEVCRDENRGVNCRMMATILNECYLAMGFKSRMVTCKPKELEFQECHVINAVFSTQANKWIWMDPTFEAYVMDEKGELLGIQEVRDQLINDKPLILNPEANWNKETSQTKENYLYQYMAKNLYRLEVPVNATFNTETVEDNKTFEYVQLLPLDGINQKPEVVVSTNPENGVTFKTYITNNPKHFWEE